MAGLMWFGTRDLMQWIAAPAVNMDASKMGFETQTNFLNGGAAVRRSTAAHKEYSLSWNMTSRDAMRVITDYADGVYGSGPIYWGDPFVMDANMMPASWGTPSQGGFDGVILNGSTVRPSLVATAANVLGYPTQSAVYTVGAATKPVIWIPIPTGYTAWVGVHGVAGTGGVVVATPTIGASGLGTPVNLTMLSVTDTNRVNQSFAGSSFSGVNIALGGTGTVTLSNIIVQVLPTGSVPATGGFISGQGHSGCTFGSQPVLSQYSAGLDRVGLSAKLVETQQWL